MRLSFPLVLLVVSAPALAQMGPASVTVAPVQSRVVQLTQPLVASVEPVTSSVLSSEEAWLVAERFFDEGQLVKKGDVLVKGKDDLVQAQRAAVKAAHDSAVARLEQAKAELGSAQREKARIEGLMKNNVGSEKEYNDAVTAEQVAAAVINVRTAEIAEQAAQLKRLDLMLERTKVVAPFDGVIAKRMVEVGQWVELGEEVAALVQADPLFVRVNVPESVISRVKKGDTAEIVFDAMGGQKVTGKVEQVLPLADAASRTFPVKILVPNPEMAIRPGFFGRATLTSASEGAQLVVPRDAVITRGTQSFVVVARDGKAVVVPVTRGPAAGVEIAVGGELKEGEQVVTRGQEALRGGEPLMIQGQPPVAAAAPAAAQ